MQRDFFQPYHHRPGRVSPAFKLTAALVFVITVVLLPRTGWTAYAAAGLVLVTAAATARIPLVPFFKRLLLLEPFVLGVAMLSLFQPGGPIVFFAMLAKSTLCLCAMLLLTATTSFTELLRILQAWRVPALLVTVLALMYRYLAVLLEESMRMQRARRSRTFSTGRRHIWKSSASVIGHLFVRTSERAERIYAAMCARGWKT